MQHTRYTMKRFLYRISNCVVHILIVMLFTYSMRTEVSAMSIFPKKVVFSEIKGVVVDKGKPVEGAEIERTFHMAMGD